MRGTRKVTEQDILGEEGESSLAEVNAKKEDKEIRNPFRYKSEFRKYQGNSEDLKSQRFDKKWNPLPESIQEIIDRSMFFSNFVNGKYKILMVYKGRNDIVKRRLFNVFTKKNKLKYNFFKQKGIIF